MLTKRKLANGRIEVMFTMPALEGVERLSLVGDFNQWNPNANPMTQAEDGSWHAIITVDPGAYQFRYFSDGRTWHNDWKADGYLPNEFGGENCVVVAAVENGQAVAAAPAKAKRAAKPRAAKPKAKAEGAAPKKRASRKKTSE